MLAALCGAPVVCAPTQALAQPAAATNDPNESRPIRAIRVVTLADDGTARDLEEPNLGRALNNIRSYPGAPYRRATVDNDIRRLNRLGTFSSVESAVQRLDSGSVDLIFTVAPRPVIVDVQVSGNTQLSDQEIAGQVDLFSGAPVDRFQVDRAARRIEELYREKGYYFASVAVDEQVLDESNIVLFTIREGSRVKVTDQRFEGNNTFEARILRRELETKTATLLRRGQLDDDKLDQDIAAIITFYRNAGYLDIRADRLIQPSPNGKEAIVTYVVDEGPLYTLRSVEFEVDSETPVYAPEQIAGLIEIKPGDAYGVRALENSLETIRDAYGTLGHTDTIVTRVERRDAEEPLVDLVIRVAEGERYLTGEVVVAGNYLTKQNVVRRHVEVRPERPLDTNAIEASERRLRQTRLFNFAPNATKITLQPPDPLEPDYRDVLVEVEETNTGEFNVGGAVSSDAGVVGRIAITQRNFDLFDTPDSVGEFFSGRAFRGAGQTFSMEVLPGDRVQTYSIALSDPYLLESNYSGNISAFYRDRDFDEFDEQRFGTRFGVGRRFGTRWNGNLSFRVESIELSDLDPDSSTDIFAVADQNVLSSVTLSLSRNTLDSPYRPTRGATSRVAVEQAGVSDFTYTKFAASHRIFIPLREDYLGRATVFSMGAEMGYVPQDTGEIPTYERFYLGGQSFRGFDFRTVSPKGIRADTLGPSEDPVGGTWLFFLGAEINQPIFEELFSVVGFVDTGTVTNDPGFDDYRVSVGFGFRFYIQQLSPAPLAFDFGFPVLKQDDDETRLFTFTVDLPF
ncbi:MAG: outer membrane protein assembly factor BamA [Phycisphaeraceae bacterium]|nr:MAG: outer membrane protein assembly factor BamA [Phycisphaeraceae bacterium]